MTLSNDQITGERIDRLMTVEIRPLSGGLPPGYVVPMYEICRAHHGEPLSSLAARRLCDTVRKEDVVLIVTGFGNAPNLPNGETDGPVGAAVLARALVLGLGARVVLVAEEAQTGPVRAAVDVFQGDLEGHPAIATLGFPLGLEPGRAAAAALMDQYRPGAVVFIERIGPNREGYFHGVRGDCRSPEQVGHAYLLADLARRRGVLSIGVGDGGNEVGFGDVRDAITAVHPYGGRCLAGHPSGLVTATATDVTVCASVSNWGAYGIAAALAAQRGRPELLHSQDSERRLIEASVRAGARDGATFKPEAAVDGIHWQGHTAFVGLLRCIVDVAC
ncbi:MAG: DUF4392 domain-containing protein [Holophaga sp.]|nr:DUF4392 domain-containing protein [Holophaga sp.]